MINAVYVAAEEGATQNPLIPATYDIVWSAVVFAIILIAFWRVFLPKMKTMLDERAAVGGRSHEHLATVVRVGPPRDAA